MSDPIVFMIPSDLPEDEWKEYLQDNINEFEDALDKSAGVEPHDPRLNIHGITIESVTIRDDEVFIDYSVNWSIYYGCDDQNSSGDEENSVSAARRGNVLTFERHVYPEPRSTSDEY